MSKAKIASITGWVGLLSIQFCTMPAIIGVISTGIAAPLAGAFVMLIGQILCLVNSTLLKLTPYTVAGIIGILGNLSLIAFSLFWAV